jgi:hypothetical protein
VRGADGAFLHVLNGDTTTDVLSRSGVPGERLAFREALITGPAPRGLSDVDWRSLRAEHLAGESGVTKREVETELLGQERALETFRDYDEVVLWFEHDLFCQVNLISLLSWFAERDLGTTRLSLICVGEFPGVEDFRGLGQLAPRQLASLFETRHEVTPAESETAARAWSAYRAPDATAVEELLRRDTSALPFLRDALHRHLARFPSVRNGLGRIENRALELVRGGFRDFRSLFGAFGDVEPGYGLGDVQFWHHLVRLARARTPLLEPDGGGAAAGSLRAEAAEPGWTSYSAPTPVTSGGLGARFRLTAAGERVLAGEADFVETNGIDLWLGGVHLQDGGRLVRWDVDRQVLVE